VLIRRVFLAALACIALGACAQSGYDASKLQSELRHAGASEAQARCVTDGLENAFDPNRLGAHSEPTLDELTRTQALLTKCGIRTKPLR
jgi:hypothetical protein